MNTYVSVVSHGHSSIIKELDCLPKLSRLDKVTVLLRDNIGERALHDYCSDHGIEYFINSNPCGFARNNNLNFQWIQNNLPISGDDVYLVLNPDVDISAGEFTRFVEFMERSDHELASISQYSNAERTSIEPAARMFSGPFKVIMERSFGQRPIAKPNQGLNKQFDWTSGAFLAVRCSVYDQIGGFSERYFMYYEDADLCLRCKRLGINLIINTDISAVHYAQYANRNIFSRMFFVSLRSYLRFLFSYTRYSLEKIVLSG